MRIIGGRCKGKKLYSVPGGAIRPSGGKLREAVFNIAADLVPDARVLDLYAGTGAFGLEALSRGAERAVLIDDDARAITTIKKNIQLLGMEKRARCIRWDISKNLNCIQAVHPPFDLVFMDPPYDQPAIHDALRHLSETRSLAADARVVIEHGVKTPFPEAFPPAFVEADRRKYGKSLVTFLDYVIGETTLL